MIFKLLKKLFSFKEQGDREYSERFYRDHEERPEMPEELRFNMSSMLGCITFVILILLINIVIFIVYRAW